MKHSISHDVAPPLAKKAAERAFEAYKAKYSEYQPTLHWRDDDHASIEFRVKGVHLHGAFTLRPHVVDLELDVPFVFRIFQKRAIEVIESEVRLWLEKAKAGEI